MKTFSLTDSGKVRDHNEDNLLVLKNSNDEYLLAVADGMGGHKAGEVASGIVVDYLKDKFNNMTTVILNPEQNGVSGFREYMIRYKAALIAEKKLEEMLC